MSGASEGTLDSGARQPDRPAGGYYALDPAHTFALFFARHLGVGQVVGRFNRLDGTVIVTEELSRWLVSATIDAASVDSDCERRDADLRGPDFFDVLRFPAISFDGRGVRAEGDHWIMDGSLTVRNVISSVALAIWFRGTASVSPARVAFHASTAVRRADFGMKRDLIAHIGSSTAPDVAIQIEAEAALGERPLEGTASA